MLIGTCSSPGPMHAKDKAWPSVQEPRGEQLQGLVQQTLSNVLRTEADSIKSIRWLYFGILRGRPSSSSDPLQDGDCSEAVGLLAVPKPRGTQHLGLLQ